MITVSSDWGTNPDATSEYRVTSDHEWTTSGKLDNAIDFDEVDDLIRVPDSTSLDGTNDEGTFELWIWFDNAADGVSQIVMTSSNRYTSGATDGYEWASQGSGNHFYYPWGGDNNNYNITSGSPSANQTWHHTVITITDNITRDVDLYIDGNPVVWATENVPTYWTTLADPADWLWGGNPDRLTRHFDGKFDEIRVSDIRRSAEWLKTEYTNQNNPSAFCSVGAEDTYETIFASLGTIASQILDTGIAGATWNMLFWDETLPSNTDIIFIVRASDTIFGAGDATPAWNAVGGTSPVMSGLPAGRYKQWRAVLSTTDTANTPTLHEVRVYYY